MKHTIELFSDQLDDIIYQELRDLLVDYKQHLQTAKESIPVGVYSYDSSIEKKELKKDIKALKRVIEIWETS